MGIIVAISVAVMGLACVVIWHNTNSYEPKNRAIYIVVRYADCVFVYFDSLWY